MSIRIFIRRKWNIYNNIIVPNNPKNIFYFFIKINNKVFISSSWLSISN